MLTQTVSIARNAFVESLRQPIVAILVLVSGITQILNTAMTGFAMGLSESGEVKSDDKLLFDIGLSAVFGLGIVLASFIATSVLSREIDNKTVLTVVSKPVSRVTLLVGKYLGVASALLISTLTMLLFLLLAIRHGVMSTASDEFDQPVLVFSGFAVLTSIGLAGWCNYFYNWSFAQTLSLLLFPTFLVAYLLTLSFSKKWDSQSLLIDFKPQVTVACVSLMMAILVFASIATAVSTRLSQVMTIVVCVGVFVFSLLSNYMFGSRMFDNEFFGRVADARSIHSDLKFPFMEANDTVKIVLTGPPTMQIKPGMPLYYGPSPSGFPMSLSDFEPFSGDPSSEKAIISAASPSLVITDVKGNLLTVRQAGTSLLPFRDPLIRSDYLFLRPTRIHAATFVAWATVPNLQHFWLLDAITQNQPIPLPHIGLIVFYGILQVGAFLALGVVLFQTRDVG